MKLASLECLEWRTSSPQQIAWRLIKFYFTLSLLLLVKVIFPTRSCQLIQPSWKQLLTRVDFDDGGNQVARENLQVRLRLNENDAAHLQCFFFNILIFHLNKVSFLSFPFNNCLFSDNIWRDPTNQKIHNDSSIIQESFNIHWLPKENGTLNYQ